MKNSLTVATVIFVVAIYCFSNVKLFSQTGGNPAIYSDTNFIFTSPRPLIQSKNAVLSNKNIGGFEIMLSNFGAGFGLIYEKYINQNYKFASELFFSGVKNTDELEYWDYYYYDGYDYQYDYRVPNKIRRIYEIPLNIGVQRYINIGNLSKSLHPFVGIMAVPTFIWEMPYGDNWFTDLKYSKGHFRIGGGVQIGADFGALNTSLISVRMRYTYVPFGGDGLESVINSPIRNFGNFYLSIALGGLF